MTTTMKPNSVAPETVNGAPVRLDTLDRYVFEGLQQRFLQVFNTKTVWATSSDKVKALERLFPEGKAKITYPYAFLKMGTWTKAQDRGNRRASGMRGTRVTIASDSKSTLNARFMPVDMTVGVEWYSNSFKDATSFSRRWMFVPDKGSLNFQIDYGQTKFDIRSIPDDSISFPQREADPDNVQEYAIETQLLIQGYISEDELFSQGVVDTVEVSGTFSRDPNTVVWGIKSRSPNA